jgi:hypothetical protein
MWENSENVWKLLAICGFVEAPGRMLKLLKYVEAPDEC